MANQEDLSEQLRLQQKRIEESLALWLSIKESKRGPKLETSRLHPSSESNAPTDSTGNVNATNSTTERNEDVRSSQPELLRHQPNEKQSYPVTPVNSAYRMRPSTVSANTNLISPIPHTYTGVIPARVRPFSQTDTSFTKTNRSQITIPSDEEPRFDTEEDFLSITASRKDRPVNLGIFRSPQVRQRHGNINTTTLTTNITCNTTTTSVVWKPTKISEKYNSRFQTTQDLLFARKLYPVLYGSK